MRKLWVLVFILFSFFPVLAQHNTGEKNTKQKNEFNLSEFLLEHVMDSYHWHIITFHKKDSSKIDISIYLPVILYVKDHGWITFCSSKIPEHHGELFEIDGVKLRLGTKEDGMYEGKLLVVNPDNSVYRPFDISITKDVLALFISSIILIWIFVSTANRYKKNPKSPPRGLQSLLEPVIEFVIKDIAESSIGKNKYEKFTPFLLTVFFFIFFNNLMGIIPFFPFGFNLTGNITITFVLALFTFIITTINGNRHYWKEIFWPPVPVWLKVPVPLMPLIEFLGIFIKPFVLMVRLFANILGGHFVVLSFVGLIFIFGSLYGVLAGLGTSVISIFFALFVNLLELLVAFIQAFVFTFLSALYFSMAIAEEH